MGLTIDRVDGTRASWHSDPQAETTPTNGRDPLQGAPWWAKVIFVVGAPMALVMWLVWSDRMQLRTVVETNGAVISEVQSFSHAHDKKVIERFDVLSKEASETNRILLAGCVNDAKTESARNNCIGLK